MSLNAIQKFSYFRCMRIVLSISILGFFIVFLFLQFMYIPRNLFNNDFIIEDGFLDLSEYSLINSRPVELHGMWEYTPKNGETVYEKIPFTSLEKSNIPAKIKVSIKTSESSPNIKLYISNCKSKTNIKINGKELNYLMQDLLVSDDRYANALFSVDFDPNREIQDIEITTEDGTPLLYKSKIILGYDSVIINALFSFHDINVLDIGVLLFLLINSFAFMIIRPDEKKFNLITLFDTILALRIFFTIPEMESFLVKNLLPSWIKISTTFFLSAQIFTLMLTCIVGFYLCRFVLGIGEKIPVYVNHILAGLFLIYGIVFSIRIEWFEIFGYKLVALSFLLIFLFVVIDNIGRFLDRKSDKLYLFKVFVVLFVIGLIFLDIVEPKTDFFLRLLFCGYAFFFFMHFTARMIEVNNNYKELKILNKELAEISIRDYLTKAYNRLYLESTLEKFLKTNDAPLHVCMLDLDFFKSINDSYGHATGDNQLCFLVEVINNELDENSLLARVGGEEFVILMRGFSDEKMLNLVEKIRCLLEKSKQEHVEFTTASFGVAKYEPGMTMKDLFRVADACLYIAKAAGRNRITQDVKGVPVTYVPGSSCWWCS